MPFARMDVSVMCMLHVRTVHHFHFPHFTFHTHTQLRNYPRSHQLSNDRAQAAANPTSETQNRDNSLAVAGVVEESHNSHLSLTPVYHSNPLIYVCKYTIFHGRHIVGDTDRGGLVYVHYYSAVQCILILWSAYANAVFVMCVYAFYCLLCNKLWVL